MDNSDVDEPSPAFTDVSDFSINDFVIFNVNGTNFPGKIVKVHPKRCRLFVHALTKFSHLSASSWQMPPKPREDEILLKDIKEKIKRPTAEVYGNKELIIEQMASYGW